MGVIDCLLRYSSSDQVDVLLADREGRTPLHYAVVKGRQRVIKLLADTFEFQRDKKQLTALDYAVLGGQVETLRVITDEMNWSGFTVDHQTRLLHCAVFGGHEDVIRYLDDDLRSDWNLVDRRNSRTCVHMAVIGNQPETLQWLLSHERVAPDLLERGDKGKRTPLHLAARYNLVEMADLLLQFRANPCAEDAKKLTPFHYAAEGGKEVFQVLLDHSRKLPFRLDELHTRLSKMSCLHIAACRGGLDVLGFLIDQLGNTFDPNVQDRYKVRSCS